MNTQHPMEDGDKLPGQVVGDATGERPVGDGEKIDSAKGLLFVTDANEHIALVSGRRVRDPDPFPPLTPKPRVKVLFPDTEDSDDDIDGHALDLFVRGFLGIVEYELA